MSKAKLPTLNKPTEEKPQPAKLQEITVEVVAVTIPYVIAGESAGYESRRCDLGSLTGEQARKLNAIRRGYDYSGQKLHNGGDVKSLADAVKVLIESVDI